MRSRRLVGQLPTGANWIIETPQDWNGTLCLFSNGYGALRPGEEPDSAGDPVTRETLLRLGYALVASVSSTPGWAVADALNDQVATLDVFRREIGSHDLVIAWGRSMGGLITAALAQNASSHIDAAVPMCASVAGPIPMLNQGLDAAFALVSLCFPERSIELVNVGGDDMKRLREGRELVVEASASAAGRARLALASALAQLPTWTSDNLQRARADPPRPGPTDYLGQLENQARIFHYTAFSPRADLEARAAGNFSWNVGVDYAAQLERSGFMELVSWAYSSAGLRLDDDLARLAQAPRIAADPPAIQYMERNLTPDGFIGVPVLTMSLTGDFAPTVTQTSAYADVVKEAGCSELLRQTYVHAPGHCASFSTAEVAATIQIADERVRDGSWGELTADALNERAARVAAARWPALKRPRFVEFTAHPHTRPYPRTHRITPLTTGQI